MDSQPCGNPTLAKSLLAKMDASRCPACDQTFKNADELLDHQVDDSCAIDMTSEDGADQNNTPIPVFAETPDLSSTEGTPEGISQENALQSTSPSPARCSQSTPEPVEVGTPRVGSQTEAVEDDPVNPSTQDIIHHITANSVTAKSQTSTQNDSNSKTEDAKQDEECLKILAGFCVDAPSEDIKACLKRYKLDKTYKQLKSVFNADRTPVIIQTIQHLGCNDTNLETLSKPDCIHKLICIIQSLLPEECGVCKETYVVEKTDPPLLSCRICLQEVHHKCYQPLLSTMNAAALQQILNIPGFIYLCPSCIADNIPDEAVPFSGPPTQSYSNDPPISSPVAVSPNGDLDLSGDNGSTETPKVTSVGTDRKNEGGENPPEEKDVKVCSHYRNNTCRHGISGRGCTFSHPKRCPKLMKHGTRNDKGCNLGKKCSDFHPKMCPMSIAKLECFDLECNLCHVKGTKRKRDNPQQHTHHKDNGNNSTNNNTSNNSKNNNENNNMKNNINPDNNNNNINYNSRPDNSSGDDLSDKMYSVQKSFLDQINLLKSEIQEVVNQKINSVLQMTNPPVRLQYPAQQSPSVYQPYHPHQSLMFPFNQHLSYQLQPTMFALM